MLRGIDISEWQGQPDFDALKHAVDFVMIRATYGNGGLDKQLVRNWAEARRVGLPHMAYHYAYPQLNAPEAEAQWFLNEIQLFPGEGLALDFEESYGDPVGWSKRFLDYIATALGYKPLIYVNLALAQAHDWSPVINGDYGLWLAQWNGSDETSDTPWPVVAMHQYTSDGSVAGIAGRVDMDVFYGDMDIFNQYCYAPQIQDSPTPPQHTEIPPKVQSPQPQAETPETAPEQPTEPVEAPTDKPEIEVTPVPEDEDWPVISIPPIEPTPVKPGHRTSEFWLTVATNILGFLSVIVNYPLPANSPTWMQAGIKVAGVIAVFLANLVYGQNRTTIKAEAIKSTTEINR